MSDLLLALFIHSARTPNLNQQNAARHLLELARDGLRSGNVDPAIAAYLADCIDRSIGNGHKNMARAFNLKAPRAAPSKEWRDREIAFEFFKLRAQRVPRAAAEVDLAQRYHLPTDKDGGSTYVRRIARKYRSVEILAKAYIKHQASLDK